MNNSDTRPVNMNLLRFAFPVTSIASILHRVSGVMLFFAMLPAVFTLGYMSESPEHFAAVTGHLFSWYGQVVAWGYALVLFYHVLAGVRHLFMDAGLWHSLPSGRLSAWAVLVLAPLGTLAVYLLWMGR